MEFNLPEIFLLSALAFTFLVQLFFVLGVHSKLLKYKVEGLPAHNLNPLSVVICARNEADNLRLHLPSLLAQDHPNFEVVVVNDRSWDETEDVLKQFAKAYANLKVVDILDGEKFLAGKKFAATMGIKAAANEWLVFTDADCKPASSAWLRGMQQPTDQNIALVLGYSPYYKRKSLLNALIRFETFFTAVNYLSFALKGMPYMGVGRNMAYKKSLFFENKGFAAHMHIPSGDDDLFVNASATPTNTTIQFHRDAQVWSEPKTTFLSYLRQKKRHFGAGKFYKPKHKFILSLQIIAQVLFYTFVIVLACLPHTRYIAAGVFALSVIIRSVVYPRLLKRLSYGDLRWWFPILDMLLMVFLVFNAIVSIFVKKLQWK